MMMTHGHKRSLAIILLLGPFLSCQERLAPGEEAEELWKICTVVNAAFVYDEQGEPVRIVQGPTGGHSLVCLCLTIDETNSGDYDDYFNDKALEVCVANATRMGYPEANDCAYWHEEGQWIKMIGFYPFEDDVRCEDPNAATGCSVR
ncbi:hypothetical protein ACNOYE_26540 [Nannocystaceae bacterium ST9]